MGKIRGGEATEIRILGNMTSTTLEQQNVCGLDVIVNNIFTVKVFEP
jgi:hypothetical protein